MHGYEGRREILFDQALGHDGSPSYGIDTDMAHQDPAFEGPTSRAWA